MLWAKIAINPFCCWKPFHGLIGCFPVGIHIWLKKGRDLSATPASPSKHLCMSKNFLAYKDTAPCCLATTKIRAGIFFVKTLKNLRSGFRGGLSHVQYYNRAGAKTSPRCGLVRPWADIETEALSCLYCGRNKRKRWWTIKLNHPERISCRCDGDCSGTKFVVKIALSLFWNKGYS